MRFADIFTRAWGKLSDIFSKHGSNIRNQENIVAFLAINA
jgi:hypothetical protein